MSATWDPIAIVGQACVLPGALSPAAYRDLLIQGQCVVSQSPAGYFRLAQKHGLVGEHAQWVDDPRMQRGGYVLGFEKVFDPKLFQVPGYAIDALDPLFHWLLYCGQQALAEAAVRTPADAVLARTELIVANLCFPSHTMSEFTERTWLELQGKGFLGGKAADESGTAVRHPINRFSSGLCASLVAKTLGVQGRAFALDAACASSLYGVKLACDNLTAGAVDLAVVLGSNRVDDLFLHAGFTSIQALSPSGMIRPFDADADGLVPAEGAAAVVLKRLDDAIRDGNTIHGVVCGVGVSNDGRGKGLLVPSVEGQQRALRQAYAMAGWQPRDVSLVECHATGTAIGDAAEIETLSRVFGDCESVPIGSHKSNIGHTMTASGLAGLLKLLQAMKAGVRPASVSVRKPVPELARTPLRLLSETEAWPSDGPRRAGLNSFGFGGNNAHLLLEEWDGQRAAKRTFKSLPDAHATRAPGRSLREPIAIVGLEVLAADGEGVADFLETMLTGATRVRPHPEYGLSAFTGAIELPLMSLKFAPLDLAETLSQQLLILKACVQLLRGRKLEDRQRTGVFIGMQCDTAVARLSARLRFPSWAWRWALARGVTPDPEWLARTSVLMAANQGPAGAIGALPNVVANRIDSQFDIGGPSFSVCCDELSGIMALEIACEAIARGELTSALVGAVDMSCEPVHRRAAEAVLAPDKRVPGDAAVALELKSWAQAKRDGDRVFAVLGDPAAERVEPQLRLGRGDGLRKLFGHSHAASGLLHVAAGALACSHRMTPLALAGGGKGAAFWAIPHGALASVEVTTEPLVGQPRSVVLSTDPEQETAPVGFRNVPALYVYRAASGAELVADPSAAAARSEGRACLAIVAHDDAQHKQLLTEACAAITRDPAVSGELAPGAYYRARPLEGEVAAVFAGAAAAYPSMGQNLLLALPQILDEIRTGSTDVLARLSDWAQGGAFETEDWLWTSSLLSQAHFRLSRELLGLDFTAALGLSSGESNALFAFGVWQDTDAIRGALRAAKMLTHELAGECQVLGPATPGSKAARWQNFRVLAEVDVVRELLRDEPRVYLTAIHAPGDLVVGGDPTDCLRVLRKLGTGHFHALQYDVVVHAAAARPYEAKYRALHHRPVTPVPGVRFYSAFLGKPLEQTSDGVADAITGVAMNCLDFPNIVQRAYDDGVRVFIEHGPRDACTRWIQKILGERDHLALAFDREGAGLDHLVHLVAQLTAAGVAVKRDDWLNALKRASSAPITDKKPAMTRVYPGHLPNFVIDPLPALRDNEPAAAQSQGGDTMQPPPPTPAPLWVRTSSAGGQPEAALPARALSPRTPGAEHAAPAMTDRPASIPVPPAGAAPAAAPPSAQALAAAIWQRTATMHAELLGQQAALQRQLMGRYVRSQTTLRTQLEAPPVHARGPSAQPMADAVVPGPSPRPASGPRPTGGTVPSHPAPPENPVALEAKSASITVAPSVPATPAATATEPGKKADARGPARPKRPFVVKPARTPVGPKFDRKQLEILASGRISLVWGQDFAELDNIERLVRNPQGDLLLVDRVTGIDAVPRSMGTGTLWTETDIRWDSWFLQEGTVPMSIMVESGQADLLLICWLGADFINRGERVYRLLGCELRCESPRWPRPGDTLAFEIRILSHTKLGPVNLFFFEYDCRIAGELVLTVRGGQAGFFSDQELAESGGILWRPTDETPEAGQRVDAPVRLSEYRRFSAAQILAFSEGDLLGCFGPGFEVTQTHLRPPRIASSDMRLIDEVTDFEPHGGPWGRGYVRATRRMAPDDWFFPLHFKNDPCMPGTLMCEGAIQAMALFLSAYGYNLDKDGWRFAPVPEATYMLRCRGQVAPGAREVVYEVFVREVHDSPWPCLYADVLGSCDGKAIFHSAGMAIQLAPEFPLTSRPELLAAVQDAGKRVATVGGVAFGGAAMLQAAIGDPEQAFGVKFGPTRTERIPRLPAPPYLAIDRIAALDAVRGRFKLGSWFEAEWTPKPEAWFLAQSASGTLPLFAQLEAGLQPCRWAATFMALDPADTTRGERALRQLDGSAVIHAELEAEPASLRSRVTLERCSTETDAVILTFSIRTFAEERLVMTAESICGLFPHDRVETAVAARDRAPGFEPGAESRTFPTQASEYRVDLTSRPSRYFDASLRLDGPMSLLLDEIDGFWPDGGAHGLGKLRAGWKVRPSDQYFQSQLRDPALPDALGIEAMAQALKCWAIETGMGHGLTNPRFRAVALAEQRLTWSCRGRVTPSTQRASVELEIVHTGEDAHGRFAVAEAWLWADAQRIAHVTGLAIQVCEDAIASASAPEYRASEPLDLDPNAHGWLHDHCPAGAEPGLPLMTVVNQLCAGATRLAQRAAGGEWHVTQAVDLAMARWIRPGVLPLRLDTHVLRASASAVEVDGLVVVARLFEGEGAGARVAASGLIHLGRNYPAYPPMAHRAPRMPDDGGAELSLYSVPHVFHGAPFRVLHRVRRGEEGLTAEVLLGPRGVPAGQLGQAALEAALQAVLYGTGLARDVAREEHAPPLTLRRARFFRPTPRLGQLRCEVRWATDETYSVQLIAAPFQVWADLELAVSNDGHERT